MIKIIHSIIDKNNTPKVFIVFIICFNLVAETGLEPAT